LRPDFPLTDFGSASAWRESRAPEWARGAQRRPTSAAIGRRAFEEERSQFRLPYAIVGGRKTRAYIPLMEDQRPLESIPDDELLRRLAALLRESRRVESELVAHIAEVDERRLYAREASPSMFAYCTEVLHLSEAEAYLRIGAARASREHPMLLTMLADGRLHLTGIAKLAPHLTRENRDSLLTRATHRSKRQIEGLLAEIAPRPDAPTVMRKLPERKLRERDMQPTPALPLGLDRVAVSVPELRPDAVPSPTSAPEPPAVVEPLAPARYKVQFTASAELRDKLERLRALMRGAVPDGDLAAIIDQAVTEKIERLEARRFARTRNPRQGLSETETSPSSRSIPAAVRRAVRERDGNRCRYLDEKGRRCSERDRLEYHHRHPFGLGGDHSPQNVCLMCRAHNQYLAEHDYGREKMARYRSSASPALSLRPGGV
jgi:5-methylcytosine-specific restriction endonuclease McrA